MKTKNVIPAICIIINCLTPIISPAQEKVSLGISKHGNDSSRRFSSWDIGLLSVSFNKEIRNNLMLGVAVSGNPLDWEFSLVPTTSTFFYSERIALYGYVRWIQSKHFHTDVGMRLSYFGLHEHENDLGEWVHRDFWGSGLGLHLHPKIGFNNLKIGPRLNLAYINYYKDLLIILYPVTLEYSFGRIR